MLIHEAVSNARSAYERQFAGQIGAAHAVAFGYARTALGAIFSAMELRAGDEVILSPLTCKVVPLTLLSLDLRPIYADVSPKTLNLDATAVQRAIGPATRAILFQHTYGNRGGLEEIAALSTARSLPLIEDRAQSLPLHAPLAGQAAVYSNNLLKPLPAASGGIAITDDASLGEGLTRIAARLSEPDFPARARLRAETWVHRRVLRPELYWLALNGSGRFRHQERPIAEEIAAEISSLACVPSTAQLDSGSRWLDRIDDWATHRSECCGEYSRLLAGHVDIPQVDLSQPLFYFPIRTRHKQPILQEAARRRVELIAWPKSTPIYPIESESQLQSYGFDVASCPAANELARDLIGLPTHDKITARQRSRIANLLRTFHA